MGEAIGFFARVAFVAAVSAMLLILVSCQASADPLGDLGALCVQGNSGACSIYQSAIEQQIAQERLYQQGINTTINYLTAQQYLANQRMQWTLSRPTVCTQQGVFTVCQ